MPPKAKLAKILLGVGLEEQSEEPEQSQNKKQLVQERCMSESRDTSDAGRHITSRGQNKRRRKELYKGYPWNNKQQDVLVQFLAKHEAFYDKSHEHFKNKAYKLSLCKSFLQDTFMTRFPADPIPSVADIHCFYKNYRDRWVTINRRKNGQAVVHLTARDQWIKDNFAFVEPHIRGLANMTSQSLNGVEEQAEDIRISCDSESDTPAPVGKGKWKGLGKGHSNLQRHRTAASSSSSSRGPSAASIAQEQGSTASQSKSQAIMSQVMSQLDDLVALQKSREPPMSRQEANVRSFAQYLQTMMLQIPEGDLWDQYQLEAVQMVMCFKRQSHQQQQYDQNQHIAQPQAAGSNSLHAEHLSLNISFSSPSHSFSSPSSPSSNPPQPAPMDSSP